MLRSSFYPLCERAGIPTRLQPDGTRGLRFHDLRHACGSLLVQAGVRPKDVQTILRHSKLSTTMDLYVHAFDTTCGTQSGGSERPPSRDFGYTIGYTGAGSRGPALPFLRFS